eukprot:3556085-Pyramimonas_sp.AAC.1
MSKKLKVLARLSEDTRSLAVESAFKKWCSSSVLVVLEPYFTKVLPHISLFGFAAERSSVEISGAHQVRGSTRGCLGKRIDRS